MALTHKLPQKSEIDLLETARLFQALAEMGNIGILVLDDFNRIEFANRMISHFIGFEIDALLGQTFTDFLNKKDRDLFQTLKEESDPYTTRIYQGIEIITAYSTPVITEMCFTTYLTRSGERKYFLYIRDISVRWYLT
ncbi:MAG: PAS domain-containing protein, partial [Pseudomonadota bacterium]